MATQLQIRRGTTAQTNSFTGAEGELSVNTTTDTVHVHDGSTAGGHGLAKADGSNIATYAGSFTTLAASGATTLSSTLAVTGNLTVDTNTLVVDAANNRVGIGISSPAEMLEIFNASSPAIQLNDGGDFKSIFRLAGNDLEIKGSSGSLEFYNGSADGDSSALQMSMTAAGIINFTTANDTAGTSKFLTFGTNSFNRAGIKCTNAATYDGSLEFYTGNASNFQERARLDSSGNFLVAGSNTNPVGNNVVGHLLGPDGRVQHSTTGNTVMKTNQTTNGDIVQFRVAGSALGSIGSEGGNSLYITNNDAGFRFSGGSNAIVPCGVAGAASDGVLSLGLSNLRYKDLHLSGNASMTGLSPGIVTISSGSYFIGNAPSGYRFNNAANTTNLMILKDNGDLSVGTTGSGHRLFVVHTVNATQSNAQLRIAGAGYSAFHFLDATAYNIGQNSNSRVLRIYSGSNTGIGVQLNPGSTSWGTFSDERLKINIEPIENALTSLSQLRTVKYHLKDADTSESKKRLGLIAQDLVGVLDEVIELTPQAEDDTEYMAVRYTEIIPVVVKAIQEQQATIEALTQRIATLENNQ